MIRNSLSQKHFVILALVMFSLLAGVAFYPVFFHKIPFANDLVTQFPPWETAGPFAERNAHAELGDSVVLFYPWRAFAASVIRQGRLPLWNPHILSGTPFLADAQSALFYPPNFVLAFLPLPIAWSLKVMMNLLLAGFFTALFVRSLGGSAAGSISAGIVYAFCGFITAWQFHSALADSAIWLPLICFFLNRLCSAPSLGSLLPSVIVLALTVLAGHPETAANVLLVSSGFAIWQSFSSGWHEHTVTRRLLWFTAAGCLAAGLASIQVIPTLEWLGQIRHALSIDWGALPLRDLLAFLSRDLSQTPNSADIPIPEAAAYAGALTLIAAPLALLHRSRRQSIFFVLVIFLCVPIIVGLEPVHWIMQHTPVMRGLKNWRLLMAVDFALAVLAGLGLTFLGEAVGKNPSRRTSWALIAGSLVASAGALWLLRTETRIPAGFVHEPKFTAMLLLAGFILLALRIEGKIAPTPFGMAAVFVLALDMLTLRQGSVPFVPRNEIFPQAPLFKFLKGKDTVPYRVASVSETYGTNFEMMYGLSTVNGYELSLRRTKDVLDDFSEPSLDYVSLVAERVVQLNDRRLDLLNVRYFIATDYNDSYQLMLARPDRFRPVFSEAHVTVFENRSVLPRALFVPASSGAIEVISDEQVQLARLKESSFAPDRSVLLDRIPEDLAIAGANPHSTAVTHISWIETSEDESTLQVENGQPGILIWSQIFYPGWKVFVDGKESPLLRADYAFIGVSLGKGTHTVRFVFHPRSFQAGSWISALTGLAMMGMVTYGVVKR